ncbi:DUF6095 family protein [Leeuwenhoekiella parthenopeia]|uniref:DUF6095 family protein n=1 Tax=Leeuwenhoekiella parthenopeia TaxID=2890320 RepID=A0ABS8GQY3_9FLAO|nr:DUF6095 family protein [Leeuwenhoekiella parthenopeia]MCC4212399.1 DUF6095 family protein [Leeuwenhoekiella parthenopeia]
MATNKEALARGVRTLAMSLLFMFLGPGILYQAFKNQEHPLYIPVLILGIVAATLAIYFGFKGINRIMKALFND